MKAMLLSLALGGLLAQASNFAQGAAPAAPNAPATAAPAAAAEEVIPLVVFSPDYPLVDAINTLATEAGLKPQFAPPLLADGKPGPVLLGPVGALRLENVTARQALDRLLSDHNLILARDTTTDVSFITPKTAATTTTAVANPPNATTPPKQDPNAPVDLAANTAADEAEMESMSDPSKEIPLLLAIQYLAKLAKVNIMLDPRLKTGIMTTNGLSAPVATNTVPLGNFRGATAQQTLDAVLNNYGLVLIPDPRTTYSQVTFKDPQAKEPLYTQVVQLKYSSVTNVMTLVRSTLTDLRSKVEADQRTAQLVILSTAREFEAVTNLIAQIDLPTKQVLIEAQLVETSKNPSTIKGIDWSGTVAAQNVSFGNGITSGTTTTTSPGDSTTTTTPNGRPITTTSGTSQKTTLTTLLGAGGLSMDTARGFSPQTAFLNADGVKAVISFLNTDAESEVVATPRAVMLDNQTASLSVTRAYPIFKTTPGSANTPAGSEIIYTNLGTILTVTPKIAANDRVSLKVVPEVSNIDSKDRQVINGQINEANVYAIRKIETQVVIPSGHTLVMGGLISDSTTKSFTKVPLLGDIPGLGAAFRRESKNRNKVNLVIFITPTIVTDQDYHASPTDFLNTVPTVKPAVEDSPWDSGKPKKWGKSKDAKDSK